MRISLFASDIVVDVAMLEKGVALLLFCRVGSENNGLLSEVVAPPRFTGPAPPDEILLFVFVNCTVTVTSLSRWSLPFLSTNTIPRPTSPRDVMTCNPTTFPVDRSTTISSNPSLCTGTPLDTTQRGGYAYGNGMQSE